MPHSPAPWRLADCDQDISRDIVESSDGDRIAILCEHDTGEDAWERDGANKRLIVAAPDLLEACKSALRVLRCHCANGDDGQEYQAIQKLVGAIALATI